MDSTVLRQVGSTATVFMAAFVGQYPVQHELRLRILSRFRAEGVEIPYPSRTIYVHNESASGTPLGPAGDDA